MEAAQNWVEAVGRVLPRGGRLPKDLWETRHRCVMVVLWLHAAAIPLFALAVGRSLTHGLLDAAPVALFAACASLQSASGTRARSVLASLGLLTASAMLVHLAQGSTEMHFHFFVMIALIALYQDWVPFLAAIAFVALHHTFIGVITPNDVYDHPEASTRPLVWAIIHAAFVLAASAAQITSWRVTEIQHERSEEALRESEQRFRSLIEHSNDGVSVIGADGTVLYDSPSVERVFGLVSSDRIGRADMSALHPADRDLVETRVKMLDAGESDLLECRFVQGDGTVRMVEARVTKLFHVPSVNGLVVNFRDITERKELEQRLAHQAFHDTLTGLSNRALFADRVERALVVRRAGTRAAVLFIDLDDFKTVNDALGHVTGDEVLVEAARRIAEVVGSMGTCARLGGDEFGVLIDDVDGSDAYDVGSRLLDALHEDVVTSQALVALNASVGLAVCRPGDAAEDLIRNADLAMYKSKALGKGRLEIFEDGMREAVLDRLALKVDMRRALGNGEFVPFYQPVVSLANGRLVGAEALVRWVHPDRGILAPGMFIDLAEESGLIVEIGLQVLAQACADAAEWSIDPSGPVGVSVNLSARQLQDPRLVDDVAEVLCRTGLPASRLTLEITESVLIADPEAAAHVLDRLKDLGLSISLDDFGTGYSSLSYLNRFPVDGLKIDKIFIDALDNHGGHEHALLQAIVGLGRTLELSVIAEGIERPIQWAALQDLGCGLGQGYLFAKPMPLGQFLAYANVVAEVV